MPFPPLGALIEDGGVRFNVWAPLAQTVTLELTSGPSLPLDRRPDGLFTGFIPDLQPGAVYQYRLDGGSPFPDPASRFQPEGVHGPSEVIDPQFGWTDDGWEPPPQRNLVFYELHVGTFTPSGTFDALRERLPYLRDLGVNAIELMPVADFPGRWNWGYDHAALFAPSRAYGRPEALRQLVNEAHALGMAVFLDVIYNHLGPDGAYVAAFAPMFTDHHHTPWGQAINLDDEHSEGVRHFFLDNARHWLEEYHLDGLRLDATHAIIDDSEPHFLAELTERVERLPGPRRLLIAEEHRNLACFVHPRSAGGFGLDGVWADDFHHQIRNMIAGDAEHYYANFAGTTMESVAATIRQGWFYTGQVAPATGRPRGTAPEGVEPWHCVFCIQNHDQIGNRPLGNRLSDDAAPEAFRAASALLLFVPELPLLFMGQEWAAKTPFQFFTDHSAELGALVSQGRRKEFEGFSGFSGAVPDPQDPATFEASTLDWSELEDPGHAGVLRLYKDLLALRRRLPEGATAEALSETALHVRRGSYHLLVCLGSGERVTRPSGATAVLHTEAEAYAPDAVPPTIGGSEVVFHRAGAVLFEASG